MKKLGRKKGLNQARSVKYNHRKTGVPGGIRTHDPLLRRQPLCAAELQGHEAKF